MAGPNDPIRLTKEMYAEIPRLKKLIQDYEWEVSRQREAGFDTEDQRKEIEDMKRRINGLERVYKPL